MNRTLLLVCLSLMAVPSGAAAQLACPTAADSAATPDRPPDLFIRARVSARSVRFEGTPRVSVRTLGCAPWDSVVVTERVNLPDPIEPGVTYRDVRVGVEIRSWLSVLCAPPADPGPRSDSVPARPANPCARILGTDSIPTLPR